jgi:hypothetical protein
MVVETTLRALISFRSWKPNSESRVMMRKPAPAPKYPM